MSSHIDLSTLAQACIAAAYQSVTYEKNINHTSPRIPAKILLVTSEYTVEPEYKIIISPGGEKRKKILSSHYALYPK